MSKIIRRKDYADPFSPMRNITESKSSFKVDFAFDGRPQYRELFLVSQYGDRNTTLFEAQRYRDSVEKALYAIGVNYPFWTTTYKYHIVGFNWIESFNKKKNLMETYLYAKCENPLVGKTKSKTFSILKYGLGGAFDWAIASLAERKYGKDYPCDIVNLAWIAFRKDFIERSVYTIEELPYSPNKKI